MSKILPFQSRVSPVTVPSATATVNKHVVLLEIDWDTGTEGYSYERIRTPNIDYLDLVESISPIERTASPFGDFQFPSVSIALRNLDLYFSKKIHNTQHRGRTVRIKILPPSTAVSHSITVMQGKIAHARISGGYLSLEVIGHNFEEVFGSTLAQVLPVLEKSRFPNLPKDQVPVLLPLLYGEISSPGGEDLENPTVSGAVPAYLVDTEGNSNTTWDGRTQAESNEWMGIAWSPELSLLVAVSEDGTNRIMTSPDGITWTTRAAPGTSEWKDIAWSPELSLFVAVAAGDGGDSIRVMYSSNGTSWTSVANATVTDSQWQGVTWSAEESLFVAVGQTGTKRIMTSPDGATWTLRTTPALKLWESVVYSPELEIFAAVASSSSTTDVMTSEDGITWISQATPTAGATLWRDIAWSPKLGVFTCVGQGGTANRIMVSADGLTWLLANTPAAPTFHAVAWSPDLEIFVAAGFANTNILVSEDAVVWTNSHTAAIDGAWESIVWAQSLGFFVAVGSKSATRVMTSPSTLTNEFRYAVGARAILGDFSSWISDPERVSLVYRYGSKVSYKKTISLVTYGNFTIPVIGFAVDQRAGSTAFPGESENGPDTDSPEIAFFATGVSEGDNVSSSAPVNSHQPVRNPVRMKEHFLIHYSSLQENLIDQLSHDSAKTTATEQHLADAGTGGVAPAALGALIDKMDDTVKGILEKLDRSFGMITFQSRAGNLGTLISPIGALPTPSTTITDEKDILKDSLEIDDVQEVATAIHAVYSFRYTQGQHGDPSPGSQYARQCPDYEIPAARKAMRITGTSGIVREIDLPYLRRSATVVNVLRAQSEYLRPGAQFIKFNLPLTYFDEIEIGDYLSLTHWQGTSAAGGYSSITVRVLGISIDPNPLQPSITVTVFRRAPGSVKHDNFDRSVSDSLGSPWVELEESSGRVSIASFSGVEGTTFGQVNGLSMSAVFSVSGANMAYLDETTDDDQTASIETVYRATGTNAVWGVAARVSGTRSSFTGYVGLLNYGFSGPSLSLVLRKYTSQNLATSSGTELGTYTLTTKSFSPNTWRNQGDTLELRCIGNRIELFLWSDIPDNNVGRAIAVTDTSITSGKAGVFAHDVPDGVQLTNFYTRGIS